MLEEGDGSGKLWRNCSNQDRLESSLYLIASDEFRNLRVIIVTGVEARIASLMRDSGPASSLIAVQRNPDPSQQPDKVSNILI